MTDVLAEADDLAALMEAVDSLRYLDQKVAALKVSAPTKERVDTLDIRDSAREAVEREAVLYGLKQVEAALDVSLQHNVTCKNYAPEKTDYVCAGCRKLAEVRQRIAVEEANR